MILDVCAENYFTLIHKYNNSNSTYIVRCICSTNAIQFYVYSLWRSCCIHPVVYDTRHTTHNNTYKSIKIYATFQ